MVSKFLRRWWPSKQEWIAAVIAGVVVAVILTVILDKEHQSGVVNWPWTAVGNLSGPDWLLVGLCSIFAALVLAPIAIESCEALWRKWNLDIDVQISADRRVEVEPTKECGLRVLVLFPNVRVTNRSETGVSLGFQLAIKAFGGAEHWESSSVGSVLGEATLSDPQDIDPKRSVAGAMQFRSCFGPEEVVAGTTSVSARALKISDHVTGRSRTISIAKLPEIRHYDKT